MSTSAEIERITIMSSRTVKQKERAHEKAIDKAHILDFAAPNMVQTRVPTLPKLLDPQLEALPIIFIEAREKVWCLCD